jgi:VIT1/CCC1 family predicted Fe2+/Mn2+ transporter
MTDPGGLSEAILLRLADRILSLEHQAAGNVAAIAGLTEHVSEIRGTVTALSREVEEIQRVSSSAFETFEQMRKPLQGLLDLRQKFTGAWLVVTALLMVVAYLFQPLLAELYHWHLGGL